MKVFGIIAGCVSFALCLAAGVCLLRKTGLVPSDDNLLPFAIGLYFMGKAFFVGPMLVLVALRLPDAPEGAAEEPESEA